MVGWIDEIGKESSPAIYGITASYFISPDVEPRFLYYMSKVFVEASEICWWDPWERIIRRSMLTLDFEL